jgi:hypothetical protein
MSFSKISNDITISTATLEPHQKPPANETPPMIIGHVEISFPLFSRMLEQPK